MALLLELPLRAALAAALGLLCLVTTACGVIDAPDGAGPGGAGTAAQTSLVAAVANETLAVLAQSIDAAGSVPQAVDAKAVSSPDAAPAAVEPSSPQPETAAVTGASGWGRTTSTTASVAPTTTATTSHAQAQPATTSGPVQLYKGVATYYGADFDGKPMASGPIYHMMDPTITASNFWPLGTRLRIWRVPGGPWDGLLSADERTYYFGHSIIVTVLDRGAFSHALDLSYGAFSSLGRPTEGVIAVYIEPLDGIAPSR